MVGELLAEIMHAINQKVFNFDENETEKRAGDLIENGKYWVFIAWDSIDKSPVGFISLYESYALYAEGAYGTIPELFVSSNWRSKNIGHKLLANAIAFAREKGWHRLEVTTPPLPEFDRTLRFYEKNGFVISGGRKLKLDIGAW
ncbi:MAG: GNAT family N-acetyltransferase [Gammaproteobacteria bacterium]|nr:GNAT family N-acetyltransferase [Gammaproteobacteria bacterium]